MSTGSPLQLNIGREYRSRAHVFGIPLLHIATGFNPETGSMRVAKGIIAIGNVAIGLIAIGGISIGGFCLGGLAIGVLTLGGASIGILAALGGFAASLYFAVGGAAISAHLAIGGFAFSLEYAFGGFAIGKHPYGSNYQDPEALRYLQDLMRRFFGDLKW